MEEEEDDDDNSMSAKEDDSSSTKASPPSPCVPMDSTPTEAAPEEVIDLGEGTRTHSPPRKRARFDEDFENTKRLRREYFKPRYNSYGFRGRPPYEIDFMNSFCPKNDYKTFIAQVDELIRLEDKLFLMRNDVQSHVEKIYLYYKFRPPYFTSEYSEQQERYCKVHSAYQEIRKQLLEEGADKKPSFDFMVACLEVVGAIIINPNLLSYVSYDDGMDMLPFLLTSSFTTRWTMDRIEKITWTRAPGVTFFLVRKSKVRFCYEPP